MYSMLCLIWLIFVWIWCLFVSKAGIHERQKFSFVSLLLQPGAMRCWNPSCKKKWLDLPLIVSQWWLASRNRCRSLLPLFLALFPKSCFSKIVSNKKKSSTSTTSTTEKKKTDLDLNCHHLPTSPQGQVKHQDPGIIREEKTNTRPTC